MRMSRVARGWVIFGRLLMEASDNPLKVGLFGIGLDTYWPQFPGLRDRLIGFTAQVAREL
jgi:L-arabinose isomerase